MSEPSARGFDGLPPELRDAVAAWSRKKHAFTIEHGAWFTDGRSGEPVGHVVHTNLAENHADQLVLKFHTHDGRTRSDNLRAAWYQNRTFRDHLAKPLPHGMVLDGDREGVLLLVAGGGVEDFGQLAELRGDPTFPQYCGEIIDSVVNGWNAGKWVRPPIPPRVGELLEDVLRRRLEGARAWAVEAGIRVDGDAGPVTLDKDTTVAYNPFALLAGADADHVLKNLRIGHAHGDLSGRNILLKVRNEVAPNSYVLIDYDRYEPDAPLARDPMHLVVALTLDGFDEFGPKSWPALVPALVRPDLGGHPSHLWPYRDLSAAIRRGSAPPANQGWGAEWEKQCLLFLVAAGLVHLGRDLHVDNQHSAKKWCFQLAALAAEELLKRLPPLPERTERATKSVVPTRPAAAEASSPIRDRKVERRDLRDRLVAGSRGVSILRGIRGVGKTKLLDVVLHDVASADASPRVLRHDANSVTGLDVGTLIDYLDGTPEGTGPRPGRSSLVRLENVLHRLGDSPVVVAVDSAENLLTRESNTVADPQLDRALEMLATKEGHAVTVLLVSQEKPKSSTSSTWPTAVPAVQLDSLPRDDFFAHLASMDHHGRLDAALLTREQLTSLYEVVDGNPRLAELIHAVVVGDAGYDLPRLATFLSEQRTPDVFGQLLHLLLVSTTDVRRAVLRVLAAFDTPVRIDAVARVADGHDHTVVGNALSALVVERIVYRAGDRYYLPSADSRLIMSTVPGPTREALYYSAAGVLRKLAPPEPRSVDDLRPRLAELQALLNTRDYHAAHDVIVDVDPHLRRWNCRQLVLKQRKEVKGRIGDEHDELENLNALADILLSLRAFSEADRVFGEALSAVAGWEDDVRAMKLHCTFASMYWHQGETTMALAKYESVRDQAQRIDHPETSALALEGIANCLRRKGRHEDAIREGKRALAEYARADFPDFPTVKQDAMLRRVIIALKLARWHGELGRDTEAERFVALARTIVDSRSDDRLRSAYLVELADLHLDGGRLDRAEELAHEAVDIAMRHHDEVTLVQARTTLSFCYLRRSARPEAWREIELAELQRVDGRSLIVLALSALAAHQQGDRATAENRFRRLLTDATNRMTKDSEDFAAHDLVGYAICGLHLGAGHDLSRALKAFDAARKHTKQAHVLIKRMRFLLGELEAPHHLRPVLEAFDALDAS